MFGEVMFMFETAVPIGILRRDTGEVCMNPKDSFLLEKGDLLIVIAEVG
jgi:uncharacterized protein with PhoU and TrkA domain